MTAPVELSELGETPEAPEAEPAEASDPSGFDGGWWLTEPDEKKVKAAVLQAWRAQNPAASKREATERRNELTRAGYRGLQVVASEETDTYDVRAPFGAGAQAKAPNKADQLIRQIASTLTVDPPGPEVEPNADTDAERESAELSQRILRVEGGPAERDDASTLRQLIDQAGTSASAFVHTILHPQDCLKPVEVQAHPAATTVDDALFVLDPMTGEQTPADPATLTTRYVRVDGTLTDTAVEARLGWVPRVIERLCKPSQIRFVPAVGVAGIADAPGVLVGEVVTLGEAIARWYGGERPDEPTCKALVAFKPEGVDWKRWVPAAHKALCEQQTPTRPDGTVADEALVAVLTLYLKSGPLAPLGAVVVVGGPETPLTRIPWRATIGEGPDARIEYLPLPVTQLRWREDTAHGDPYGIAGIEDLAAMDELRAALMGLMLDYVDKHGAPQVFLPVGSTIQPQALNDGALTGVLGRAPIYVTPDATPFYAPQPPLTPVVPQLYDGLGKEMDTASGLKEAAQGLSDPNVRSGAHARQIIDQAMVSLAGIKQNADKAICRLWSIRLTFMRAFYRAPRLVRYAGEGGDYQARQWTGADLMGNADVRIARGTGTMLPAATKQTIAREEMATALQAGDQMALARYYRAVTGQTSTVLGLQDDPIRQRIARQLATWRQGAKQQHEAYQPPEPEIVDVDAMGQPVMAPVPPDPVALEAARCFAPNPSDDLPHVAPIRFAELTETLASHAFLTADPRYQQALVAEWARMKAAAGVMTLAEQQQAQAAQQAQAQQEALETANATQAAKTAYAEREGGPAAQRMAIQGAVEASMRPNMTPQPGAM